MRRFLTSIALLFLGACDSDSAAGTGGTGGSNHGTGGTAGSGAVTDAAAPVTAPCGIYLVGGVRSLSFLAGTLGTVKWSEVEPVAGQFDFTTLQSQAAKVEAGQRFALRMTGVEPDHVASGAEQTWVWVNPNPANPECVAPDGCVRPVPWDEPTFARYEALVHAIAQTSVTIDGVEAPLASHPSLESVMLTLPGWSRIRELGFEVEELPGYDRDLLIEATKRALGIEAAAFPGKPVFTQFFTVDDGAEPPLWEAMRDAILSDPELRSVGFYEENLAHTVVGDEETFRPMTVVAAPLYTSKESTFTGFQALTSWADPMATQADQVAGGSPALAMRWALETYNTRYFELYTQDVDAPDWLSDLERLAPELCPARMAP